jgi:hypothetical protein
MVVELTRKARGAISSSGMSSELARKRSETKDRGCAAWDVYNGTRRPDVEARDAPCMRSYRRWTGVLA